MSILEKFEFNSWGNRQLTERAFVEIWQTSKSINEVEDRYESLQEEYFAWLRQSLTYEKFLEQLAQKKLTVYEVENNGGSKTQAYRHAKRFIEEYDGKPYGYRLWYTKGETFAPRASLTRTAKRLRKNGVRSLRNLPRTSGTYYSKLNDYASSLL